MSRENVEVVRRVYDAAQRRDAAAILRLYDPEVELDGSRLPLGQLIGESVRRGHEGLRAFFREVHEAWENLDYEVAEILDADDDRVVSVVTRRGRGRTSGAEAAMTVALVWTLRGGKVVRVAWFPTREDALDAAGLRE